MFERLAHAHVGVVQLHVFAHQGDLDRWFGAAHIRDQLFPDAPIRLLPRRKTQALHEVIPSAQPLQHQRHFIKDRAWSPWG